MNMLITISARELADLCTTSFTADHYTAYTSVTANIYQITPLMFVLFLQ
jgi:hypothetical protein